VFDQNGLSLDQAPPIGVILGLFVIGSIFGILSGISILYYGYSVFDYSTTGAIVTTHLLAVGVMMSFMLGALLQMLPVIAGVVIEQPTRISYLIRVSLVIGLLALVGGFVWQYPTLYIIASVLLGGMLLYVSVMMLVRLVKLPNHSASSRGMTYTLLIMGAFVMMALYMTTTYSQLHSGEYFLIIKQMHYSYALYGWIGLLIASISFQAVEMFYVTPAYPVWLSKYLPIWSTIWLILLSISLATENTLIVMISSLGVYLGFAIYAIYTLIRLSQRKRPLADATVWFWRIGMISLILGMLILGANISIGNGWLSNLGTVMFGSFVLSVLMAMFYKIVPFLTWFHLNAQGYLTAPMMHEVIHPKNAKRHMWVHLSTIVVLVLSTLWHPATYPGGMMLSAMFAWILYLILHARKLYNHTRDTGERFDMN